MFELEEFQRRPVLLPTDVVVHLDGQFEVRPLRRLANDLNERPLRLVQVPEC